MTTDDARPAAAERSKRPVDVTSMDHVTDELLSLLSKAGPERPSMKQLMETLERNVIVRALTAFNGHQAKTASFLSLLPTTFSAKMRKHKIVVESTWTTSVEAPRAAAARVDEPATAASRDPDPDPGT